MFSTISRTNGSKLHANQSQHKGLYADETNDCFFFLGVGGGKATNQGHW